MLIISILLKTRSRERAFIVSKMNWLDNKFSEIFNSNILSCRCWHLKSTYHIEESVEKKRQAEWQSQVPGAFQPSRIRTCHFPSLMNLWWGVCFCWNRREPLPTAGHSFWCCAATQVDLVAFLKLEYSWTNRPPSKRDEELPVLFELIWMVSLKLFAHAWLQNLLSFV